MTPQIVSTSERLAKWGPIFKKFEESGLSQRKFCMQERLNFATFTKWLQLRNQLELVSLKQASSSFLPVQLEVSQVATTNESLRASPEEPELVVELPLGVTLRFRGLP